VASDAATRCQNLTSLRPRIALKLLSATLVPSKGMLASEIHATSVHHLNGLELSTLWYLRLWHPLKAYLPVRIDAATIQEKERREKNEGMRKGGYGRPRYPISLCTPVQKI
jgi:hypothetical protein